MCYKVKSNFICDICKDYSKLFRYLLARGDFYQDDGLLVYFDVTKLSINNRLCPVH